MQQVRNKQKAKIYEFTFNYKQLSAYDVVTWMLGKKVNRH